MKKITKNLLFITPFLIAAILVATFLPNLFSSANPDEGEQGNETRHTETRPSENEMEYIDETLSPNTIEDLLWIAFPDGEITEMILDENGWYLVALLDGNTEYQMIIDSVTGEFLDLQSNVYTAGSTQTIIQLETTKPSGTDDPGEGQLTRDEAVRIALERMGGQATIKNVNGEGSVFLVEVSLDDRIFDLRIDGIKGTVTGTARPGNTVAAGNRISSDEAGEIALDKVGGGTVTAINYNEGTYNIEVSHEGNHYGVQMDASTGQVAKVQPGSSGDRTAAVKTPAKTSESKTSSSKSSDSKSSSVSKTSSSSSTTSSSSEKKSTKDSSGSTTKSGSTSSGSSKKTSSTTSSKSTSPSTKTSTSSGSKRITASKAESIALARVGGGTVVELEYDDGEYEVEIKYNGKEYEIEINAYTGKIIDVEVDDDDDDDDDVSSKGRISSDRARQIALDRVGGGRIVEFEYDDGEYEIEIEYKGREYEIEIDAYTGRITDFEIDD